jgi:hypothetical protein
MTSSRPIVLLVIALLVLPGAAGAVSAPRDQPQATDPPVRVFVGETLDVSAVESTGGGALGSDSVTLVGVGGAADGVIETIDDPTDADFDGFATGSYDVQSDADDDAEFSVVQPRVTRVVVRNQNDANVTNGWEPTGASLTVTAEYNFDEADRLDLSVEAPDGLNVTSAVAAGDRITTSGGSVRLDLSDQSDGTFRITVEGSDLDDASRTVTVRTGPHDTPTERPTSTPIATTTTTQTETTATETETDTTGTETESTETTTTQTGTETTATETETQSTTETEAPTTSSPTTTTTTTPGLGAIVAVAALALVALGSVLVRRRP